MLHARKISAAYDIVTPMFLGGADQRAVRIRETSFKGALAFWWRALHFSKLAKAGNDDLSRLMLLEQKLFGGPKGQGAFLLKIDQRDVGDHLSPQDPSAKQSQLQLGPGACYFGYGLVDINGRLERSCIAGGGSFTVDLIFKPAMADDPQTVDGIVSALKLLGLLGGLGSRVRRGWGSLALRSLSGGGLGETDFEPPRTHADYVGLVRDLVSPTRDAAGRDIVLSAFARESRFLTTDETPKAPLQVLDDVGKAMQQYRSWGFSNQGRIDPPSVNGKDSEKNFLDDHDWSKGDRRLATGRKGFVPRRAAFGLPQNYTGDMVVRGGRVRADEPPLERRASPLLVHIHKTGAGKSFAALTLLPTKFLPRDEVDANGEIRNYDFHREGMPILEHFLRQDEPDPAAAKPFSKGPYLPLTEIEFGGGAK